MIHFCIVTLGSDDLLELSVASIQKYVSTPHTVESIHLPLNTDDPREHGRAIDEWRQHTRGLVWERDTVVIMDPDVAILSLWWERQLEIDLYEKNPDNVGIWGAGSTEDFGPRVHASMMAIRGKLWNGPPGSFNPCTDPRERTWRDTGGLYCMWAKAAGWELRPVERGSDWHGFSAWYWSASIDTMMVKGTMCHPLWTHLGGGSHSDPARMTWLQRIKRYRAVRERERWKRLVHEHLA